METLIKKIEKQLQKNEVMTTKQLVNNLKRFYKDKEIKQLYSEIHARLYENQDLTGKTYVNGTPCYFLKNKE